MAHIFHEQIDIALNMGRSLVPLMALGKELIITHGNGPVVGKIHLRQALARHRVEPMSLDICVAHSQGGIAYLLMQALENALREIGNKRHVVCLLTQVEVDLEDPAFKNPTYSGSIGSVFLTYAFIWRSHRRSSFVQLIGPSQLISCSAKMATNATLNHGWRRRVIGPPPNNGVNHRYSHGV